MNLSFIIYYHSSRFSNLQQTIRFLRKREETNCHELVLVCQDNCNWKPKGFKNVKSTSLNLSVYHKPKMCNIGVEMATGEIIAILDSDRILPIKWFENTKKTIKENQIITTYNLQSCKKDYTDDEIDMGKIELTLDPRCPKNSILRKNAFSGNTVMFRKDYLSVGGMDENYVGYGFADNDMVKKCIKSKMNFLFKEDMEIHLYHKKYIIMNNKELPNHDFKIYTAINGLRYCLKWKIIPNSDLINLIKHVKQTNPKSPELEKVTELSKKLLLF